MNNLERAQLTGAVMAANETLGSKSASHTPEDRQVLSNLLNPEGMSKKAQICQVIGSAQIINAAEVAEEVEG